MPIRGRGGIHSRAEFDALSRTDQELYVNAALEVVQLTRNNGYRFDTAVRTVGLDEATAMRLVGSAFTREAGKTVARPTDALFRPVRVFDETGEMRIVDLIGSKRAADALRYRGAVTAYSRPVTSRT